MAGAVYLSLLKAPAAYSTALGLQREAGTLNQAQRLFALNLLTKSPRERWPRHRQVFRIWDPPALWMGPPRDYSARPC